jgi:hypothetical protein
VADSGALGAACAEVMPPLVAGLPWSVSFLQVRAWFALALDGDAQKAINTTGS